MRRQRERESQILHNRRSSRSRSNRRAKATEWKIRNAKAFAIFVSSLAIDTYYSFNILVHIASEHIVRCGIQLIQWAGRDLQHSGQTNARPMIFISIEALQEEQTFHLSKYKERYMKCELAYESIFGLVSEFPVIFQYGAEYIIAILWWKFDRIQFLILLYG